MNNFLAEIEKANPSAVILTVMQPFAAQRKTKTIENLPQTLDKLFDPIYQNYSLDNLRSLNVDLSISKEEQNAVEKKTANQSNSNSWFKYKAGRITASNFKSACRTSIDRPSLSLIKSICYPLKVSFKTKQVIYGIEHEDVARKAYEKLMKANHQNLVITTSGLVISTENPMFGASPDGLVSCECCGPGCIEIKCPYRLLDSKVTIQNLTEYKDTFLIVDENNFYKLNNNHSYFYQVQLQMYCTQRSYCDFVVWSKSQLFIERINFDLQFLTDNLQKAYEFHSKIVIPELLAKWYTQSRDSVQLELWCFCLQPDDGRDMICCSNINCDIKWFHKQCVSVFEIAENELWYCKKCVQSNEEYVENMEGVE